MTPQGLLAEAARRGIELYPDGLGIRYRGPRSALDDLRPELVTHKVELLVELRAQHYRTMADNPRALLNRPRCYTLPTGRIPAIHAMAHRVRALREPAAILSALQGFERELIEMGGQYDLALAEAMQTVATIFPSAKLVDFRKQVLS